MSSILTVLPSSLATLPLFPIQSVFAHQQNKGFVSWHFVSFDHVFNSTMCHSLQSEMLTKNSMYTYVSRCVSVGRGGVGDEVRTVLYAYVSVYIGGQG